MSTTYTIGSLAKSVGVPASTLRHYERVGLLVPSHRSAGNYRLYNADDLSCLRFIKAAQSIGFTLDDIRVLLGLEQGDTQACTDVQGLIEGRLDEVSQRLRDLKRVQKMLRKSLALCKECPETGRCEVIGQLAGHCDGKN